MPIWLIFIFCSHLQLISCIWKNRKTPRLLNNWEKWRKNFIDFPRWNWSISQEIFFEFQSSFRKEMWWKELSIEIEFHSLPFYLSFFLLKSRFKGCIFIRCWVDVKQLFHTVFSSTKTKFIHWNSESFKEPILSWLKERSLFFVLNDSLMELFRFIYISREFFLSRMFSLSLMKQNQFIDFSEEEKKLLMIVFPPHFILILMKKIWVFDEFSPSEEVFSWTPWQP